MDREEVYSAEVQQIFLNILKNDEDISVGVAAIKTLITVIKNYKVSTVLELHHNIKKAATAMRHCDQPVTAISSCCELFLRFITYTKLDVPYKELENILLDRGEKFLDRLQESRAKIAKQTLPFIRDGYKILTHSKSRVVFQAMLEAHRNNKRFQVFVTMSGPDNTGVQMHEQLKKAEIDATLILDSAVGYIMEQVNIVMVGAEGVTESGGIINKIGTYTIAMAASAMKKPFYVLPESFKFARIYPLNQQDVPKEFKYLSSSLSGSKEDLSKLHPLVDYTPPVYITLLFSDIGVLSPSAVSDELMTLYT